MDKDLTFNEMYNGLKQGKQYILKDELRWQWRAFKDGTLRFFVPGGSSEIHQSDFGEYFAWTHAGSSANDATEDGLKFILETIFDKEPSDFTELNHHAIMDVINEGR